MDDLDATMSYHDQSQFIAQILHLLDLGECSVFVEIGEFVDYLGFIFVVFLEENSGVRLVKFDFATYQIDEHWIGDLRDKIKKRKTKWNKDL